MDRLQFEKKLWSEGYTRVMGLDEVGRGCLSGPVVAAGVILNSDDIPKGIRDSKMLSLSERIDYEGIIKEKATYWTVQWCTPDVIDDINILHASLKAMQKCTEQSGADPDYLLVDGNRYGSTIYPHQCIIKGDDRSLSIAAASILAKVYRDNLMKNLHEEYPHYGWDTNVGYPTKEHFSGLQEYGITVHHRRSFRLRTDKEWRAEKG
ncbi:MAG: ribonuclease HII [Balneolaceae bacterium]|nr:ribonuclease HII [Balneolaceae bacterium]